MKCNICDVLLTPEEIHYNQQHKTWDPCNRCKAESEEVFEPLQEEEIDKEFPTYDEDWETDNEKEEEL